MNSVQQKRTFCLAGNATVTFRSQKTGNRYTYKITKTDGPNPVHFVKLLTGVNNETDYQYMGIIRNNSKFCLTARSHFNSDSEPVKAFDYTFSRIASNIEPAGVEVFHEGRCGRCGRKLTVPASIQSGLGPECASKV